MWKNRLKTSRGARGEEKGKMMGCVYGRMAWWRYGLDVSDGSWSDEGRSKTIIG